MRIWYLVFSKSQKIIITKENYTDAIFTRAWLNNHYPILLNKKGWYWLHTTMPLNILVNLTPVKQKGKGCFIDTVVEKTQAIFNDELLSKAYFYNGHAASLVSRLRNHFHLQNDNTGALGLNAYDAFKNYTTTVHYFSEEGIENSTFTEVQKTIITKLISENIGRTAIENAWRATNGFPILCKH